MHIDRIGKSLGESSSERDLRRWLALLYGFVRSSCKVKGGQMPAMHGDWRHIDIPHHLMLKAHTWPR